MDAILFNPQDPYFAGADQFEVILKDPRVTVSNIPAPGSSYNPSFDQKNWAYPAGTGRVTALQLDTANDVPSLLPYVITAAISSIYNLVSDSNKDGIVPFMPLPLIPLTGKQAIVKVHVSAGLIQVDEWWVIQDSTLVPMAPTTSPAGGSFTDADRKTLTDMSTLMSRIGKVLGL